MMFSPTDTRPADSIKWLRKHLNAARVSQRRCLLALSLGVALIETGCDTARLNHWHSDSNQEAAEAALADFEAFSSEQVGLGPVLLKNLEVRTGLFSNVTDRRVVLNDAAESTASTAINWLDLRFKVYEAVGLGIAVAPEPDLDEAAAIAFKVSELEKLEPDVDLRVEWRLQRIHAITEVLHALAAGQLLRLSEAQKQLDKSLAELGKVNTPTTNPASSAPSTDADSDAADLLNAFDRLREAVISAATRAAQDEALRAQGDVLRLALLDDIKRSRDPASAYALAAIVGTGLDDASFANLDDLLKYLSESLSEIVVPVNPGRTNEAAEFAHRLRRAQVMTTSAKVLLASPEASLTTRRPAFEGADSRATAVGLTAREANLVLLDTQTADATTRSLLEDQARLLIRSLARNDRESEPERMVPPAGHRPPEHAPGTNRIGDQGAIRTDKDAQALQKSAETLMDVGTALARRSRELRSAVQLFPAVSEQVLGVVLLPEGPTQRQPTWTLDSVQDTLDVARGKEFLLAMLLDKVKDSDALNTIIEKAQLTQADIQQIGQIATDIDEYRDAYTRRVLEYLAELYRIRVNLLEEDARHYKSLASIASQELGRWERIGQVNFEAKAPYQFIGTGVASPAEETDSEAPAILFANRQLVDSWDAWVVAASRRRDRVPTVDFSRRSFKQHHAVIGPEDQIMSTLRRLAETARAWQQASANEEDPLGWSTARSLERLRMAVQVLNANLLLLSANAHFAATNVVRLRAEIEEHGLHLDGLEARATEAPVRLGLQNQAAFHGSGITDADVQAAIGIVQSILLGIISGRV